MHDHLTPAALTNIGAGISSTFFAMTDTVSLGIVAGVANVVIGVATLYFAYRAKAISQESKEISTEAKEISAATGQAVNGKMEEFKKMAESFFHAKGVADEKVSAESKAGVEAIAMAKGRAEGISAPASVPHVVAVAVPAVVSPVSPVVIQAAPAAVATPVPAPEATKTIAAIASAVEVAASAPTRMGDAIIELKSAAEETSIAADKTVDLVDKQHPKP